MTPCPPAVRRVILVVLDGLRADAAARHALVHLPALARAGRWTLTADTVRPSVTAAAMTSLFTGVTPAVHGLAGDGFRLPRRGLATLPGLLRDRGIATFGFMAHVPLAYRALAATIARHLGCSTAFRGETAAEILDTAAPVIAAEPDGLFFLHWPDADRTGHAHGWHSPQYGEAARALDSALGRLARLAGVPDDPSTLLIAFADHGGGGKDPADHDSTHPDDTTIPLVMTGGGLRPGQLDRPVSLLDIPATALWALGVDPPASFSGRPLIEAFSPAPAARAA